MAEFKDSKQIGIELYTDGLRDKNKVATATVTNKDVFSARLPDEATIFSADAKAIELAFEHIKMFIYTHCAISSDSLSCLLSLHSMYIDDPYISKIKYCTVITKIPIKVT